MTNNNETIIKRLLARPEMRKKGFEMLVRCYSEPLYRTIRNMVLTHEDADDLLQNTFVKAWLHLSGFENKSKISTWLYRIAVNETLDFLRKQKNKPGRSSDGSDTSAAGLVADPWFDGNEAEALLRQVVAELPLMQRTVFNLRYFEEMKYAEMSRMLDVSEGSLKASYHIAVKKIADFFTNRD